jgi:mono/diheme cytochrome c family protein
VGEGEKSEGRLNSELVRAKQRQDEEFMNIKMIAVGVFIAAGALALNAEDVKVNVSKLPPAAAKQGVTFDADIKPIFEKSCFKCHGPEVEKPKGKFRADTKASVIKGGGDAPPVTAGDLTKSPLIAMVARQTEDEELFMPPTDNKAKIPPLTKDEIGLVRAWIEQGAK